MEIKIREYRDSDRTSFAKLMEELQDYLVSIDDLKRMRRMPEYGESYTERTLENVAKNNGMIYVAETKGKICGAIVGIIHEPTKEELLELIPIKRGVILELIVKKGYRNKSIGTALMEKMEDYFKQNSCTASAVEVFLPNKNAYGLYKKFGYIERTIYLTKNL